MRRETNYSLLCHNTFGVDVCADCFCEYETVEELGALLKQWHQAGCPQLLSIGGGSNLLFTRCFEGWVMHSAIKDISVVKSDNDFVWVKVGAGIVWDDFVDYAIGKGMYGAENLSFIPGEVGASAVQNIGAYGVEAKDLIEEVEAIAIETGEQHIFSNEACEYDYRQSIFKKELKGKYIVTYVTYRMHKEFIPQLGYKALQVELDKAGLCEDSLSARQLRDLVIAIRKSKLPNPNMLGNAGSFFMNPVVSRSVYEQIAKEYETVPHYEVEDGVKIPAGWLIEQCGWKGKSLGKAAVYEKQALVLVNTGGAKGEDILALCHRVCNDVKMQFGITIYPEVNIL